MSKPVSVKDKGPVVLDTGAGVVPDTVQEAAKRAVVFIDTLRCVHTHSHWHAVPS